MRGASAEMEMDININRPGMKRNMRVKLWNQGADNTMVLILEPTRDKGTVYLKQGKEVWYYVPAVKKQIKLPANMMMQKWMGTDLTNDNLLQEGGFSSNFTHKLLGEKNVRGADCHVVELTPKPEAAVAWSKMVAYITKTDFIQVRSEFFDEDDELASVFDGFDIKTFDGKKMPSRMRFSPQDGSKNFTEVIYREVKFNVTFANNFFSRQNMATVQ